MDKKALIVYGGWERHEPGPLSEIFKNMLAGEGFEVTMSDSLAVFEEAENLTGLSLIVPIWTMGELSGEAAQNIAQAVENGCGIAGCHGGMCDAFRNNTLWQFLTGAQWVAHPGGNQVRHTVHIKKSADSAIIEGMDDFEVISEQYYLHIDPAIQVLAATVFPTADGPHAANGRVEVPVAYTKRWGKGKVFYLSLGHNAAVFDIPQAAALMKGGFVWAAKSI